jgi:hypothetical protein
MSKKTAAILACAVLGSTISFNVQAFPITSAPAQVAPSDLTLVEGFCGPGSYRDRNGVCRARVAVTPSVEGCAGRQGDAAVPVGILRLPPLVPAALARLTDGGLREE